MLQPRFRALTKDDTPVYFSLTDVPVLVYPSLFALTACEGSSLLRMDSIVRAADHIEVAEGDVLSDDTRELTVVYDRGFYLSSSSKSIPLCDLPDNFHVDSIGQHARSKLQLRFAGEPFSFSNILGSCKDGVLTDVHSFPIDISCAQVSTGLRVNKKTIFFGDIVKGWRLTIWHGCVGAWTPTGFRPLNPDLSYGGNKDGTSTRNSG